MLHGSHHPKALSRIESDKQPSKIAQKNTVMTNVSMTVASPAFPDGFNTYL